MTLVLDRDQVAQMYEVAKDDELAVLDTLAERAGLRWTCHPKPEHDYLWTNYPDEACGRCERSQQEAATYDEQTKRGVSPLRATPRAGEPPADCPPLSQS